MKINNRIISLENYHFKEMEDLKKKLIDKGTDVLDLSIGDPDIVVNSNVVNALINALYKESFNKYPSYDGLKELKNEIIKYYKEVYEVSLQEDEVLILIGSKEGISNIIPAVCNIGDEIIVTSPGYPVYSICAKLWGVNPYLIPITEKNNYLPNLSHIPEKVVKKSKMFFINYPNNPTGAVANEEFYRSIIDFCNKNDIILCNDGAYNEIIGKNIQPLSLLKYDKFKTCIEFGTFSKTFNMTGFRIGYVVGNRKVINALLKVKSNLDSGVFKPIQYAAIEALKLSREYVQNIRKIYDARKVEVKKILQQKNLKYYEGKGTFYIWCNVPTNYSTEEFCQRVLYKNNIMVTPGYTFGNLGYDYYRIALTQSKTRIVESFKNLDSY